MATNRVSYNGKVEDVALTYAESGLPIVAVTISQPGKKGKPPTIVTAKAFGEMATDIADSVKPGNYLTIEARLTSYEYTNKGGDKKNIMNVNISSAELISKAFRYKPPQGGSYNSSPAAAPPAAAPPAAAEPAAAVPDDDEPPF